MSIFVNVPLFHYSYLEADPDYGVGLNQLDKFGMNYQTINKFSGISSGVKQDAYLHAFSHLENEYDIDKETLFGEPLPPDGKDYPSKISLLNYLTAANIFSPFSIASSIEPTRLNAASGY